MWKGLLFVTLTIESVPVQGDPGVPGTPGTPGTPGRVGQPGDQVREGERKERGREGGREGVKKVLFLPLGFARSEGCSWGAGEFWQIRTTRK